MLVCVVCVFVWEGSEFAAYEFLLCVFEFVCVSGGGVIVQQVALFCVCLIVCMCVFVCMSVCVCGGGSECAGCVFVVFVSVCVCVCVLGCGMSVQLVLFRWMCVCICRHCVFLSKVN